MRVNKAKKVHLGWQRTLLELEKWPKSSSKFPKTRTFCPQITSESPQLKHPSFAIIILKTNVHMHLIILLFQIYLSQINIVLVCSPDKGVSTVFWLGWPNSWHYPVWVWQNDLSDSKANKLLPPVTHRLTKEHTGWVLEWNYHQQMSYWQFDCV